MTKIQSQKTTEYSMEPKQKQAKGAQVIEITVYLGCVKQQEQNYREFISMVIPEIRAV